MFLSWTFVGALWQAKEQRKSLRKILSTNADTNNKMQPIMVAVNERDHLGRIWEVQGMSVNGVNV